MYDQIYKRIDDTLWKDAGCGSELDYVEQSSWILFLKYLDDLERIRAAAAELDGRAYAPIIERKCRWSTWAVPKKNGEKDLSKTLTGDDLLGFVRGELFPYLRAFKTSEASPDTQLPHLKLRLSRDCLTSPDGICYSTSQQQERTRQTVQRVLHGLLVDGLY